MKGFVSCHKTKLSEVEAKHAHVVSLSDMCFFYVPLWTALFSCYFSHP